MSYQAANYAIEQRLSRRWETTSIKWPNVEFEPTSNSAYIELRIIWSEARKMALGVATLHRAYGKILIDIFVSLHTGARTAADYADELAGIFRNVKFSGITCRSPVMMQLGETNQWWRTSMSVDIYYDKIY